MRSPIRPARRADRAAARRRSVRVAEAVAVADAAARASTRARRRRVFEVAFDPRDPAEPPDPRASREPPAPTASSAVASSSVCGVRSTCAAMRGLRPSGGSDCATNHGRPRASLHATARAANANRSVSTRNANGRSGPNDCRMNRGVGGGIVKVPGSNTSVNRADACGGMFWSFVKE